MSQIYKILNPKNKDPIDGFGLPRYIPNAGGIVGEDIGINYEQCNIVATANSIDGTIVFNSDIGKYYNIEIDIINSTLSNTGLPHIVAEDTLEWVNSGTPSHLSQVLQSNVVNLGIYAERSRPGQQQSLVGPFQAKYITPCEHNVYDGFNSTIDFEIIFDTGNRNVFLPYANTLFHKSDTNEVWVGGPGGILIINISTKNIEFLNIDPQKHLNIKSIKDFQGNLYILDESGLYIYDLGEITRDNGIGLGSKLFAMEIMINGNIIIGGNDGLYLKKPNQDFWTKVIPNGSFDILTAPDAAFAVSNRRTIWYSSDGFSWKEIGDFPSNFEVNSIQKHRSQILIGTTAGLYQDSGTLYGGSIGISLIDLLGDIQQSSNIIINDIRSDFDKSVISLSDGRYVLYSNIFDLQTGSKMSSIHKTLIVDNQIWLFGYDTFRVSSDNIIRRLATGLAIL